MSKLNVVILAAGKGSRMHSDVPKVLHTLAGKPLLQHVLDSVASIRPAKTYVVYGHGKEHIEQALKNTPCHFILQPELLGTGHAVQQAMPHINDNDTVLVLYGDMPLISAETLKMLIASYPGKGLSLLTLDLPDPTGYGRIVREHGRVMGIVEEKDASPEQRYIQEIYTGIMLAPAKTLKRWLGQLTNNNTQKEYYITDIISMAQKEGFPIETVQPKQRFEAEGINNRNQQANLERVYQQNQAIQFLEAGVTLRDLNRFDIRGTLKHGQDVVIDTNVIIEGQVTLGNRVEIGTGSILKNCVLGDDVIVSPYTIIEESHLGNGVTVGPFAHIRPGCNLHEKVHVGNFVELKKTTLGKGSKAGHLTYLGDSDIGKRVNIGAGTITCNYDGANKHKTLIGDDVFVGSDTQFIAPIMVGKRATIGAGTTVTHDVGEDELILSRVKQQHIRGWQKPTKKKNQ